MKAELVVSAVLKSVKLVVKAVGGMTLRRCQMELVREFDDLMAAELGTDARRSLIGLKNRGVAKVELPIDAMEVDAELFGMDGSCTIQHCRGVKAVGKMGAGEADEDLPPTISLTFEFPWNEDAWLFLGKNCGGQAHITMRPVQEELPFTSGTRTAAPAPAPDSFEGEDPDGDETSRTH